MLERVVREFEPIVQRRKYNVRSVSELCCCNDGLDFEPNRQRKLRKSSDNIWGYNQTTWHGGSKSHTIHLRLRHATGHSLFHVYEDVAGTLAHELAHCEYGPHNDKFYKLMDEILEEHSALMASKITFNGQSLPSFGGSGYVLGGTTSLQQARQQQSSHGYKLGGDTAFTQWMTPKEAAAVAAEARRRQQQMRLRGDRCCRPCTIEIDDDGNAKELKDSSSNGGDSKKPLESSDGNESGEGGTNRKRALTLKEDALRDDENRKPSAKFNPLAKPPTDAPRWIDLTSSSSPIDHASVAVASLPSWPCWRCTFLNQHSSMNCDMCETERDLSTFQ